MKEKRKEENSKERKRRWDYSAGKKCGRGDPWAGGWISFFIRNRIIPKIVQMKRVQKTSLDINIRKM